MSTPLLSIPELTAQAAGAEEKVNAALRRLEVLAVGVLSIGDSTPPGSPADGDAYIVGTSATGDWLGHDRKVAVYSSGWIYMDPAQGLSLLVRDVGKRYTFDGTNWQAATLSEFSGRTSSIHAVVVEVNAAAVRANLTVEGQLSTTYPVPLPFARQAIREVSVMAFHLDGGGDPGDWTLNIEDENGTPLTTVTVEMPSASYVSPASGHRTFVADEGTEIEAGSDADALQLYLTGPATATVVFRVSIVLAEIL